MEDIHNFSGGLHTNFDSQNQPKNTYRDATNWIRLEDGSLMNEKGTIPILGYPTNYTVIGSIVINEDIVLFSQYSSGLEIGVLDKYNIYRDILVDAGVFETTLDTRIVGEARIDYRGHRIVYFCDIHGSMLSRIVDLDRDTGYVDLDAETMNQLAYTLPDIEVLSITEQGNLPTGIYQFSTRLLTSSSNPTTTSLLTNVIPIVNEARNGGVDYYDGALPQTSSFKAINLSISSIDTNFKFIQVIATTYEGLTNTLKSNVIGTRLITSDTLEFTYYGLEQNEEELTLDEITVEPVELDYPKTIKQKDGRLLYGNLRTKNTNADLQELANNIVIKYNIKEVLYNDYINDVDLATDFDGDSYDNSDSPITYTSYKNELNTTNFKGYQRDEVYSFAIAAKYKNGTYGYAYHIPCQSASGIADTGTKLLGKYEADAEYPTGFNFGALEGTSVSYHRMPSIAQETLFTNTGDDSGNIRILGVEFTGINISLVENNEDIIGFVFLRELRTEANKSILAQGIANPVVPDDGNYTVDDKRVVAPFAGKVPYTIDGPNYSMAFWSPETTIYNNPMNTADRIKTVANLFGKSYVANQIEGSDPNICMFLNYHTFNNYSEADSIAKTVNIDKNTINYIPPVTTITPAGVSYQLKGTNSNGFLFFEVDDFPPIYLDGTADEYGSRREIQAEYDGFSVYNLYLQNGLVDSGAAVNPRDTFIGPTNRHLFNLVRDLNNQYGEVLDKEYIFIGSTNDRDIEDIELYGGDIFINKTAIMTSTSGGIEDFALSSTVKTSTLSYFFCESTINTAYRHHIANNTVPYYPAYRKFWTDAVDGLFQYGSALGHANGYNKQYSFDNNLKKFYSKSLLLESEVDRFSNRVMYSEQAIEGEQFDAYRLFLPNNYHDIPKNKGEITNLFIHKNDLYIHTSQSLWKSSFNERVSQTSSVGEVVLGNGGLFPRPSLEVFPISGGYAGSVNPLATINSPAGVFFVDGLQRKVFLLGDSFEDVESGLRLDFQYYLKYANFSTWNINSIQGVYDYEYDRYILTINNRGCDLPIPEELLQGDGMGYLISDRNNVKVDDGVHALFTVPSEEIRRTISYSPRLKSWASYHTYYPYHMVSNNYKLLFALDSESVPTGSICLMNRGLVGDYFGISNVSELTIISNDNPLVNKVFDNMLINTIAYDISIPDLPEEQVLNTFAEISLRNNNQASDGDIVVNDTTVTDDYDFIPNTGEIQAVRKNDDFKLSLPFARDVDNNPGDERFKSKWLSIRLVYDNSSENKFVVKYLTVKYRVVAR